MILLLFILGIILASVSTYFLLFPKDVKRMQDNFETHADSLKVRVSDIKESGGSLDSDSKLASDILSFIGYASFIVLYGVIGLVFHALSVFAFDGVIQIVGIFSLFWVVVIFFWAKVNKLSYERFKGYKLTKPIFRFCYFVYYIMFLLNYYHEFTIL